MKFRKTALIEAEQFTGSDEQMARLGVRAVKHEGFRHGPAHDYFIDTLEGPLQLHVGHWIATGIKGEHWAIAPDVFAASYEPADG